MVTCHSGAFDPTLTHVTQYWCEERAWVASRRMSNHGTFALEETLQWTPPFHLTDRQTKMGWGIISGSQCLPSSFWLKAVRVFLVLLTNTNTKSLWALSLEKKCRFNFIFLSLHFLSFKKQLPICNIKNMYSGEGQSNRAFSFHLHFESAHVPPNEY